MTYSCSCLYHLFCLLVSDTDEDLTSRETEPDSTTSSQLFGGSSYILNSARTSRVTTNPETDSAVGSSYTSLPKQFENVETFPSEKEVDGECIVGNNTGNHSDSPSSAHLFGSSSTTTHSVGEPELAVSTTAGVSCTNLF